MASSTGISFQGIASQLPVDKLIDATMSVEEKPLLKLQDENTVNKAKISAYGQLSTRIESLMNAMKKLEGLDKFQIVTAKSANSKLFTAKADSLAGAQIANHDIEVVNEAKKYRHSSEAIAEGTTLSGLFTIEGVQYKDDDGNWQSKDVHFDLDALVDKDGNPDKTLERLRSEINKNEELKGLVTASIVTGSDGQRLVLNAVDTGEKGRFSTSIVSGDSAITSGLAKDGSRSTPDKVDGDDSTLLDAVININGVRATSETNTFKNVISGVDITVAEGAEKQTEKTASLKVDRDDEAIINNVNNFVKAYNDVVISMNTMKTDKLEGENTLQSVESILRNVLSVPAGDDPNNYGNYLSSLGITTKVVKGWEPGKEADPSNGTLIIDNDKLRDAIDEDFEKVAFILGDDETGYATRMHDAAQQLIKTTANDDGRLNKGLLEVRTEGLQTQIKRNDTRIESMNYRLELLKARLEAQYAAIEPGVSKSQNTQQSLIQQFANMPGYGG